MPSASGPLLVPAAGVADLVAVLEGETPDGADAGSAAVLDVVLVARPGAEPTLLTAGIDALHDDPRVRVVGAELAWHEGWRELGLDDLSVALEVPRGDDHDVALADIRAAVGDGLRAVAKLRTGPTPTWPWPDEHEVADFLVGTSALAVPFRLTGGLHHAVRGRYAVDGVVEDNHGAAQRPPRDVRSARRRRSRGGRRRARPARRPRPRRDRRGLARGDGDRRTRGVHGIRLLHRHRPAR